MGLPHETALVGCASAIHMFALREWKCVTSNCRAACNEAASICSGPTSAAAARAAVESPSPVKSAVHADTFFDSTHLDSNHANDPHRPCCIVVALPVRVSEVVVASLYLWPLPRTLATVHPRSTGI